MTLSCRKRLTSMLLKHRYCKHQCCSLQQTTSTERCDSITFATSLHKNSSCLCRICSWWYFTVFIDAIKCRDLSSQLPQTQHTSAQTASVNRFSVRHVSSHVCDAVHFISRSFTAKTRGVFFIVFNSLLSIPRSLCCLQGFFSCSKVDFL